MNANNFLEGLPSGSHICMVVGIVLGKGKGIVYYFGREDGLEIDRFMLFKQNDIVVQRSMEFSEAIR